jgi:hypothetical protein
MSIFLAAHALGDVPFDTWHFELHYCVQESVHCVYFFIVGIRFDIDEVKEFICSFLFDIPYIRFIVAGPAFGWGERSPCPGR